MSEITLRIDRPVYRTKSGPVMRVLSEFYMFPFNRTYFVSMDFGNEPA